MMQAIPKSQITVGDMAEIEFLQRDSTWKSYIGRVVNSADNELQLMVADDSGNGWTSLYLFEGQYRNPRLLEKGPWHNLICGNIKPIAIKTGDILYDPIDFIE